MPIEYAKITYAVSDGVATLSLDDPETRNALSDELLDELLDALAAARDDDAVRCLVLASTHETVFSSGASLGGLLEGASPAERRHADARLPESFRRLRELGKPSLCAASGHVLAGALGLALACDLVVAREEARFGTPEINVGLFPFLVMALIRREVGAKRAAELMLLGEQLSAREAERIGLVNRVVAVEAFDGLVADWSTRLAARSPLLMRLGSEAMRRHQDMAFDDALQYLRAQQTIALSTDDIQEGVRAFLEGRPPNWTGR